MARQVLTAKSLEAMKPDGTRRELPDGGCRGLYHFILPSGTRSWYFRFKNAAGKQCRLPLGLYPDIGLAEARKAADKVRADVRAGGDPAGEKARTRKLATGDVAAVDVLRPADPFRAVWKRFDESHIALKLKAQTAAKWRSIYARHFAPLWDARPVNEITPRDIEAMIHGLRATLHAADTARMVARVFFNWASSGADPILSTNPAEKIGKLARRKGEQAEKDRPLSDSEVRALWNATATGTSVQFGSMVRLLLLTGARRNEVAQAVWSEFDLAAGVWKLPAARSKSGRAHTIYLSPEALDVLNALPRLDGVAYVFPSEKGETPVSGFSKNKARLDKAMGTVEPWRLHDLRRTFSTGLARLGISQTVTARCLNHASEGKQTALDRVYNRHDYGAEQADAWQRWASHVSAVVRGDDSNVVPLVPLQVEHVPA
jgi:integrase